MRRRTSDDADTEGLSPTPYLKAMALLWLLCFSTEFNCKLKQQSGCFEAYDASQVLNELGFTVCLGRPQFRSAVLRTLSRRAFRIITVPAAVSLPVLLDGRALARARNASHALTHFESPAQRGKSSSVC